MRRRIQEGDDIRLPKVTFTLPSKKRKLDLDNKEGRCEEVGSEDSLSDIDIGMEDASF
jgi:hypothetical protein